MSHNLKSVRDSWNAPLNSRVILHSGLGLRRCAAGVTVLGRIAKEHAGQRNIKPVARDSVDEAGREKELRQFYGWCRLHDWRAC